jgi:hypothetical protein
MIDVSILSSPIKGTNEFTIFKTTKSSFMLLIKEMAKTNKPHRRE